MLPRLLPAILCLVTLSGTSLRADPAEAFAEANRLFEAGDSAAASVAYESIAREGLLSPDLFYNLGATKHRLGESGEGVLWMRRALFLEPGMPEARQSLAFLRSHLAFFEFADSPLDRFVARLPSNFGRWTLSIGLWIGFLALATGLFIQRFRPNRSAMITLGLISFMVAFVASRAERYRATRVAIGNFATVIRSDTNARTAPAPEAKAVIALPPGSEVRILQPSGSWSYVEIPGDLRGWVRSENISPVWPITISPPAL